MTGKTIKRFMKRKWKDVYRYYIPKFRYAHYYKKLEINEKAVLFESQHGTSVNGSMFYMMKTMIEDPAYDDFEIYFSCRALKESYFRKFFDLHGMQRVNLVVLSGYKYMQLLASAKYLVNNNTFLPFYVKKEGQVYLNTWHGTPLKTLGKKIQTDRLYHVIFSFFHAYSRISHRIRRFSFLLLQLSRRLQFSCNSRKYSPPYTITMRTDICTLP